MIKTTGDLIAEAQKKIRCVDIDGAKRLYESAESALIVDVREADSVAQSKLSESLHISRGLLEMKFPKQCADPDILILTHCGGGGRASLAAQTLQEMGYTNVYAITARYEDIKDSFG